MKPVNPILIASIICLSFITQVCAQTDQGSIPKETSALIAALNRIYSQAFEKHKAELILRCYAEDASILAPNAPTINTPQGILAFFNGGYAHGIRKITFHTTKLFGYSGTFVNEEGRYELKNGQGKTIDEGKYIVVWKKTDSGWKMYRDIFNTNLAVNK